MAKRPVPLYAFKAFGAAIKATGKEYGESRKKVSATNTAFRWGYPVPQSWAGTGQSPVASLTFTHYF